MKEIAKMQDIESRQQMTRESYYEASNEMQN
jgi:hypothetical protein